MQREKRNILKAKIYLEITRNDVKISTSTKLSHSYRSPQKIHIAHYIQQDNSTRLSVKQITTGAANIPLDMNFSTVPRYESISTYLERPKTVRNDMVLVVENMKQLYQETDQSKRTPKENVKLRGICSRHESPGDQDQDNQKNSQPQKTVCTHQG